MISNSILNHWSSPHIERYDRHYSKNVFSKNTYTWGPQYETNILCYNNDIPLPVDWVSPDVAYSSSEYTLRDKTETSGW